MDLHVDEALALDTDEQRVDGSLGDVREPHRAKLRRDLVPVRGSTGEDAEDDALERALQHLRHLLAHAWLLGVTTRCH
jgi:hypothetical protein